MLVAAVFEPQIRKLDAVLRTAPVEESGPRAGFHHGRQAERHLRDAAGRPALLEIVGDEGGTGEPAEGVKLLRRACWQGSREEGEGVGIAGDEGCGGDGPLEERGCCRSFVSRMLESGGGVDVDEFRAVVASEAVVARIREGNREIANTGNGEDATKLSVHLSYIEQRWKLLRGHEAFLAMFRRIRSPRTVTDQLQARRVWRHEQSHLFRANPNDPSS